jgi:hypothetical protein
MATINPFQGPINYAVDVQSPFEAALGGFKLGAAGAEAQAQAQVREQAKKAQTELATLFKNPNATAADYERVLPFLPKDQAAIVTQGFERKTKDQQQSSLQQSGQVYAALKSGQPDIAKNLLADQAAAFRNSGREPDAKATETYLQMIDLNPIGSQATIGLMIASLPGGKELLENVDKTLSTTRAEALQPAALALASANADKARVEAQEKVTDLRIKLQNEPIEAERLIIKRDLEIAQADKAQVDAEFARANAVLDAQKKSADIRKTDADILIAQEDNRIKALNAAQAKETNVLRRAELQQKIDDATKTRDQADRDQKATLANQIADIDNFINTATRIKQTPRDIINAATGPIASRLPTTNQDVSDFESLVETLGSQAFLAQIPKIKGTGNLTEKEGDKLQASLQNLSLKQSPDRLLANVDEAVRLLEKSRVNITARSGLPALPSDVPARELNVTVGGTTYNFPTKAAADTFKNSDAYKKAAGIK